MGREGSDVAASQRGSNLIGINVAVLMFPRGGWTSMCLLIQFSDQLM